jgi:hypothetical protein
MENHSPYKKLSLTLALSLVLMYAVMFLNVDDVNHVYLSVTRLYMAVLMVAPMAVLMVLRMRMIYTDRKKNAAWCGIATLVFVLALVLLRTQTPIGDVQYMRAMIPHHSSAILTSKHARITDPEVKKLSEGIIASQEREIQQMKALLNKLAAP